MVLRIQFSPPSGFVYASHSGSASAASGGSGRLLGKLGSSGAAAPADGHRGRKGGAPVGLKAATAEVCGDDGLPADLAALLEDTPPPLGAVAKPAPAALGPRCKSFGRDLMLLQQQHHLLPFVS